nr:MAG TPA: hypothetical protein [Caudoviricetes sp.]
MTPWHEYLIDVYITSKFLIAGTCFPIGIIITCVSLEENGLRRAVWGFLLAFLGLAIPVLLPSPQILIKLLEW